MSPVSVIIPTYNRPEFLEQAIESVLSQKYAGEIEIIIADDGSNEETLSLLNSYKESIHVLLKPSHIKTNGVSAARNRGFEYSKHPYIFFLDSDDFFLPGHIHKSINSLEKERKNGFSFCLLLEKYTDRDLYRRWTKNNVNNRDIKDLIVSRHNVVQTNAFAFKREVIRSLGGFNENLSHGEDIDLWMRVSEKYSGIFINSYGAVIRKHSIGRLTDKKKVSLLKNHFDIFLSTLKRNRKFNFRFFKLSYIVFKYFLFRRSIFRRLYDIISERKTKWISDSADWKPLKYFID